MQFKYRKKFKSIFPLTVILLIFVQSGCADLFKKEEDAEVLARVGEKYLYKSEVENLLHENLSAEDSTSFINNYIRSWATRQLLLSKARINLTEEQISEFEKLVSDYRTELYTRAYKEALVTQAEDTTISRSELNSFYEEEKENFKLKEKLVKLRFVELPVQFLNKEEVKERLRRFDEEDLEYLDSVGVQFRKLNFNDSLWVPAARVIDEIPPLTYENEKDYLKKSQFFELEDESGVYLAKVNEVLQTNDIAPLSYIEPTIRQVLLNRRKMRYLRNLETELLDEAIQQREFEIFESGHRE